MESKKNYHAHIHLGKTTDTLDTEGKIIQTVSIPELSNPKINDVLNSFTGTIMQTPPYFCALKKNGVPLYKFARNDIFIRMRPRPVYIYDIKIISYKKPILKIDIVCGKGTYIRSLGSDIAKALGTVGYLVALSRERVGIYNKRNSFDLEEIVGDY